MSVDDEQPQKFGHLYDDKGFGWLGETCHLIGKRVGLSNT